MPAARGSGVQGLVPCSDASSTLPQAQMKVAAVGGGTQDGEAADRLGHPPELPS